MTRKRRPGFLLTFLFLLAAPPAPAQTFTGTGNSPPGEVRGDLSLAATPPAYAVTDLGTLGGTLGIATSLNDRGQVVGFSNLPGDTQTHAFIWDSVNGIQDLIFGSRSFSGAQAINNRGQIAGGDGQPFLYDSAGLRHLPSLGGASGIAYGINNLGQVVGQSDTGATSTYYGPLHHAFVWDAAHGLRDISTFGPGNSVAYGINRLGQIAGWQDIAASGAREHAFFYDPKAGLTDLGTLSGGTFSDGLGLNDLGQVIGTADANASFDVTVHGVLFQKGLATVLGSLGGFDTQPNAINDRGQIVGSGTYTATGGSPPQHAALLSPGAAIDLNTLIDPAAGWVLSYGAGLSNVGQIVGTGTINGQTHAFLLTPLGADQSVAYQINPAHTGAVSTFNFGLPLAKAWSVDLGQPVSYPLIAGGKVFVIAGGNQNGTTPKSLNLYALDAATGATAWGPVSVLGAYPWAAAAYDAGRVFVVNTDGLLSAFDAGTGTLLWSRQISNQYAFSAPPTAVNGLVYIGGAGNGGTLYAVQESDGSGLWSSSVMNGGISSPAVTADGVYVSCAGPHTYKFDPSTGNELWHYSSGIQGGGGATSVLYNGSLYIRSHLLGYPPYYNGLVLNAANGAEQRTFDPGADGYGPAPAFDGGSGFFVSGGSLQAQDATTGSVLWTDTPTGAPYVTAPVIVSGLVFEGAADGTLDALDPTTGARLWTDSVGAAIAGPDEVNVTQPLTGMGAGEGRLLVPAGTHLIAYAPVPPNPVPGLGTLSPAWAPSGQAVTLTLTGTGFTTASQVSWNGTALATTLGSPTQLTAQVPTSLTASPGLAAVAVSTPAPGGGTSAALNFIILRSISGTVTLQGWAGTGEPTPTLIFVLTPTGSTTGSALTRSLTPTPTASASAFTFALTNVPAGTYTLGVKGPLWLRQDAAVDTTAGSQAGVSLTLPAGDVNGDDYVDGTDFALLSGAYGSKKFDANFQQSADLNGDGFVDGTDFALLSGNYGTQGKPF